MKIQLDTTAKVIRIEESVNLGEFIAKLTVLFPDDGWKEYRIEAGFTNWVNPIIIEPHPYTPTYPVFPWWQQPITISHADNTTGTYNIQIS
jgi:hypothetical protein